MQVAGQLGEANVVGMKTGDDLVADLPHRSVVVAEELRANFFFPRRPAVLARPHQCDLAADVLPQQLFRFEQIVLVVLFEHAERRGLGQRAEVHRGRIDGGGDVHELQIEAAGRDPQISDVADQRDVGVVDGHREVGLVRQRCHVLSGRVRRGIVREVAVVDRDNSPPAAAKAMATVAITARIDLTPWNGGFARLFPRTESRQFLAD